MHRDLLIRLILPLLALIAISVFIHLRLEADGFFLNLTTELIGIAITISYVDWVIRRHEKIQWKAAHLRIADRLQRFLNKMVTGLRSALGYGIDILDERVMQTKDPMLWDIEIMRVATEILGPTVRNKLDNFNSNDWKKLTSHLVATLEESYKILSLFENKLNPEQYTILIDLQDALQRSLTFYQIFPDIAGVPDDKLPKTKTPAIILKKEGYDRTASEIREVINQSKRLSESFASPRKQNHKYQMRKLM